MDGSQYYWGRQLFCWFVKITLAHEKWSKPFKMKWDRCETWNLEINDFFFLVQLYFSHRPVFLMAIEDMTNGQIDHHEKLASNIIRLPNANGYCHADKKYSQSIETMFILSLYFFFCSWFLVCIQTVPTLNLSIPYSLWIDTKTGIGVSTSNACFGVDCETKIAVQLKIVPLTSAPKRMEIQRLTRKLRPHSVMCELGLSWKVINQSIPNRNPFTVAHFERDCVTIK